MRPVWVAVLCCLLPWVASASDLEKIELPPVFFDGPATGGLVQASIAWGAIRVAEHDGDWVEVSASATEGMTVEPLVSGSDIELRVEAGEGFHEIYLDVLVPPGTSLALEVRRGGEVVVSGAGGAVEVSNRNGSVELTNLRGSAVVNARNGSVTASFERVDPEAAMAFSTLNGSVDVTLPATTAADVRIRYNLGGVESDFPVEGADVSGLEARETRVMHARINGGGPRYYFETANGTVYLRRGS